jgi:hypothetical protein
MSRAGRVRWAVGGLCLMLPVAVAAAQYGGAAVAALNSDDAGITTGKPLSLVAKTSDGKPLADGTLVARLTEERDWRDSKGRIRREVAQIEGGKEPVFSVATIIDPVKNTITTLHMDTKVANVVHLPQGTLHPYVEMDDKPMYAMPGVQIKIDKLPGKSIAGVNAVGRRVTRTRPPGSIGNDKTIVSVSERWVSPDLGIVLATSMDDPREQRKKEVTELDRREPDAALFQVPADYTVNEAEGKPLHQVVSSGH